MEKKKIKMIQLEEENFKVDSSGWKQIDTKRKIHFLESPARDIWEYVDGVPDELVNQQLFTWSAAVRETEKAGKKMPTDEEWDILTAGGKNLNLKKVFSGTRGIDTNFYDLGTSLSCWSSSVSGGNAWSRYLGSGRAIVRRYMDNQAYGFSVRCIKD